MKIFGTKRNASHLQKKKKRWLRATIIILMLCLVTVGGVYALLRQYVRPPEVPVFVMPNPPRDVPTTDLSPVEKPEAIEGREIYTLLIIGEENSGGGRTDSLIFAAIDTVNGGLTMLNIPRDLMVDTWQGAKINSIMPARGVDALLTEVERLVGFMPDHHIIVNLDAFVSLVEVIDGVYFDVPMRMVYDDPYRDRIVHMRLEPGLQHLNGEDALNVFRFRQNNDGTGYLRGDIDRIVTQQNLLRAIAEDLLQIRNVTRIHELAGIFMNYVETNLPLGSLIYYALQLMGMDSDEINFFTLPANYDFWRNGISYVIMEDIDYWLELVNTYLNPYPVMVTEENVHILTYRNGGFQVTGGGRAITPPAQ